MTERLTNPPPAEHGDTFANMPGYIPATDYARAYYSDHLRNNHVDLIPLLSHVNCEYLSHPGGKPPTLLALKQHARALAILIRAHCISTRGGEVDGANNGEGARIFREGEAFDWLNDLSRPYENTDPSHAIPLTSLSNHVKRQSDEGGPEFYCPFQSYPLSGQGEERNPNPNEGRDGKPYKRHPFQTHQNLLMHANECLEILDHEFSATGGFMSILPTKESKDGREVEDMKAVRSSLVGQWLLFTQHLVARMHELEISYGQSLDVLAGEASVPLQMAGRSGAMKGTGREIGFPQDRWILANAGDDVFDYLHQLLDKKEAHYEANEAVWKEAGVSGQRLWAKDVGGDEVARGIVSVDVRTRYYRLKNTGKSTIFVLPAWEGHPTCKSTSAIEKQPTVVAVPAPQWPPRVSDWEAKSRGRLESAETLARNNQILFDRINTLTRKHFACQGQLEKTTSLVRSYEAAFPENTVASIKQLEEILDLYRQKLAHLRNVLPAQYHTELEVKDTAKEQDAGTAPQTTTMEAGTAPQTTTMEAGTVPQKTTMEAGLPTPRTL